MLKQEGNGLTRERTYELVARTIERRILDNEISPGDVLPSETLFATQLGVNRSTLREALRTLEQNGLVMREAGRKKLRVSAPQPKDIARRIASSMIIRKVSIRELYEAMCILEPAGAENAASRRGHGDIEALEDNLSRTRQAIDHGESLVKLDVDFHRLVGQAARNRALDLAREPLTDLFCLAFYPVMSRLNAAERLLVAHGHIVEAIKAGDAVTARAWMERHVMDFRRCCELANLDMDAPVSLSAPK